MERFLGEGGRKRVYLARDGELDRDVAVAIVKTEGLDENGRTRIRREVEAMIRLHDDPHIVRVLDVAEQGDDFYIVTEYMAGGDLAGYLAAAPERRLPVDMVLSLAEQLCAALEHAHANGLIHRDVKPGNIWLEAPDAAEGDTLAPGRVKLGDFGLALDLEKSRITQEGLMVGTVAYMPPEQAFGRPADARSDLYALGAVLYEMVTGQLPFQGADTVAILTQHINAAPVRPSWHNPKVPAVLEGLILQLLAKAPADRPASAAAVRKQLRAIVDSAAGDAEAEVAIHVPGAGRMAWGRFVGRSAELTRLKSGVDAALSAQGSMMLLSGDPGIGKTRLTQEMATYAQLRGAAVLLGRCYEGEGAPVYWPWVQIIRAHVQDTDADVLRREFGPGASNIAQVVSDVHDRLPELGDPVPLEPDQARFRLFDSVTNFLKSASTDRPLVLILDDLHWADKPSLLLLEFLGRELRHTRVLVVGTYRDVEVDEQHPLTTVLANLRRDELFVHLPLGGLEERDVFALVEAMTRGSLTEDEQALARAVHRETEGNPFFIEELILHLTETGTIKRDDAGQWSVRTSGLGDLGIPEGIRAVLGRRLARLSEACNNLLTIGAVIGRDFAFRAVERVSDVAGDALVEALEEAERVGIVAEAPGARGHYRFTHALIRETLYERLSGPRRARAHRRVGDVLEKLYQRNLDAHLPELAHHFFEAASVGDPGKAVLYATRAGARAMTQVAYEEAAAHYTRALEALELTDDATDAQRYDLLQALGHAHRAAGDVEPARQAYLQAAGVARTLDSPEALAAAVLGIGDIRWEFGVLDQELIDLLEEALAALPGEDSLLRARAIARLAQALYFSDPLERVPTLAHDAVEMARRLGDPEALAYTLHRVHVALWGPQNVDERVAMASELLEVAKKCGDNAVPMTIMGHFYRATDLLDLGRVEEMNKDIDAIVSLAGELRQPYYLWVATHMRAGRAMTAGNFQDADQLSLDAYTLGQRVNPDWALQYYGKFHVVLGLLRGGMDALEPTLLALIAKYPIVPGYRGGLSMLYAEAERPTEAKQQVDYLAKSNFDILPRDLIWPSAIASLVQACAYLGDQERAAVLYELLLPYERGAISGFGTSMGPTAAHLGRLATILERWDTAERHFVDAVNMSERMGARPWVAWTRGHYAHMLVKRNQRGDRAKALTVANDALATANEFGMQPVIRNAIKLKLEVQGLPSGGDITKSIDLVAATVGMERPDLSRHAAPDGTVTILFSDIQGFTSMTERLGDLHAQEVLHDHNAIVRKLVDFHRGYEVKSEGDGFMLAFDSARRAINCAIEMQREFMAYSALPEHEDLRVRMGLHTGEVIHEAEDFFGKNVILASRIADQAEGGQILVSAMLRDLTASAGDMPFGESHDVQLKGLSGVYTLIGVDWEHAAV